VIYAPTHPLVVQVAGAYGLRADLLSAQIAVESSGNTYAWNPEPRYRYLWNVRHNTPFRQLTADEQGSEDPPADFPCLAGARDQEWWAQQASWGLLQVMGSTAREFGFLGPYLPELCDPEKGLMIGAKYLRWCLNRNYDDYRLALARFNGTGQDAAAYARKVFDELRTVNA